MMHERMFVKRQPSVEVVIIKVIITEVITKKFIIVEIKSEVIHTV